LYDQDGRVTQVGGSYARTGLPSALALANYDAANRLSSWGSSTINYDGNGNLLSDGANNYVWNARNQLASISGATTANFQYDPFGRRSSKSINGTTTGFLYNGFNVAQELSGSTPTANLLTGGLDEVFARTDTSARYFLSDHLLDTVALADQTGTVQTQYTYEPYGNTSSADSATTNSFQFTGRENDGAGLYYYRGRYCNPIFQRFVSQDPIGIAGGLNLYAYVGNNPISFRDPLGRDKSSCGNLCIGGLVALGIGAIILTDGLAAPEILELAEAEGAGDLVTVTHFTSAEGAAAIGEGGSLYPGSFVTTSDLSGLSASEVESTLEVDAGKGAFSTTFQTPASNLGPAYNGPLTSGGVPQFQVINPTQVTTFTPTP
jgi:RHS repeat-associated protein